MGTLYISGAVYIYDIEVKRRFKLTVTEIISRATILCICLLKERDDTAENHVSTCTILLYCKIKQKNWLKIKKKVIDKAWISTHHFEYIMRCLCNE